MDITMPTVTIYLSEEDFVKLSNMAKKRGLRSASSLAKKIVEEWLRRSGE